MDDREIKKGFNKIKSIIVKPTDKVEEMKKNSSNPHNILFRKD